MRPMTAAARVNRSSELPPPETLVNELNPVTQFVELAREILYVTEAPSPIRLAYATVVSVVVLVVGWTFFQRRSRDLSEVL